MDSRAVEQELENGGESWVKANNPVFDGDKQGDTLSLPCSKWQSEQAFAYKAWPGLCPADDGNNRDSLELRRIAGVAWQCRPRCLPQREHQKRRRSNTPDKLCRVFRGRIDECNDECKKGKAVSVSILHKFPGRRRHLPPSRGTTKTGYTQSPPPPAQGRPTQRTASITEPFKRQPKAWNPAAKTRETHHEWGLETKTPTATWTSSKVSQKHSLIDYLGCLQRRMSLVQRCDIGQRSSTHQASTTLSVR